MDLGYLSSHTILVNPVFQVTELDEDQIFVVKFHQLVQALLLHASKSIVNAVSHYSLAHLFISLLVEHKLPNSKVVVLLGLQLGQLNISLVEFCFIVCLAG